MTISSFDHEHALKAANKMADASSELSPTHVSDLASQQTTAKWGTQPGPQAFMTAYTDALHRARARMIFLRVQASDLKVSTQRIADDATETDAEAAQQMKDHWQLYQSSPLPNPAASATQPTPDTNTYSQ